MREVADHQLGDTRTHQFLEVLNCEAPTFLLSWPPEVDTGSLSARDVIQRLVAGEDAHHVIVGAHQSQHHQQDAFFRRAQEHIVGPQGG